jgi:hypothetical protein
VRNSPLVLVDPDGEDYYACGGGSCSKKSDQDFASWGNSLIQANYKFYGNSDVGIVLTPDGLLYGGYAWNPGVSFGAGFLKEAAASALSTWKSVPGGNLGHELFAGLVLGKSDDQIDLALSAKNNGERAGQWAAVISIWFLQPQAGGVKQIHHIASKYRMDRFKKYLDIGGLGVEHFLNKMPMLKRIHQASKPGHPPGYHDWVEKTFQTFLEGATTARQQKHAIRRALIHMREELTKDPGRVSRK